VQSIRTGANPGNVATEVGRAYDCWPDPSPAQGSGCSVTDPSNGRRLIGELTIGLSGEIDGGTGLAELILAAAPTNDAGCPSGIVDAAGLQ
jgi:ribonuclease T2